METDKDKLKAALLKRALGYEYDEREIIVDKDGEEYGKSTDHKTPCAA